MTPDRRRIVSFAVYGIVLLLVAINWFAYWAVVLFYGDGTLAQILTTVFSAALVLSFWRRLAFLPLLAYAAMAVLYLTSQLPTVPTGQVLPQMILIVVIFAAVFTGLGIWRRRII